MLLDSNSRIVAVGATGPYGRAQVAFMRGSGSDICALVSAGRGGGEVDGLPIYDTVAEAVAGAQANAAIVYTPPLGVRDSVMECADAGIDLSVVAAEHVPVHDTLFSVAYARQREMWVVGPNTVGMVTPGIGMMGGLPAELTTPGRVGVIGRSGTLTINVTRLLTKAGVGQSTVVHIGGDMLCGRNPHEWLLAFQEDQRTDCIVYLGEIGGGKEYELARHVASTPKPVIALIVGRHAPPGKKMGHAGALVEGTRSTAAAKIEALAAAGAHIARSPMDVVELARKILS